MFRKRATLRPAALHHDLAGFVGLDRREHALAEKCIVEGVAQHPSIHVPPDRQAGGEEDRGHEIAGVGRARILPVADARAAEKDEAVVGALLFMIWPFFGKGNEFGTLALAGGVLALAVYFMTLKKTRGGMASDFLQRLANRQRAMAAEPPS